MRICATVNSPTFTFFFLFYRSNVFLNSGFFTDSSTSQTSSIAESIEEQSEMEDGSGERTPTNDNRETTSSFSTQRSENKGGCYLDEEIPCISLGFFFLCIYLKEFFNIHKILVVRINMKFICCVF